MSLGTKDVAEAKRRAHPHATRVEPEFEAARRRLGARPRTELSDNEIDRLAAVYLHRLLEEDDTARVHGRTEDDDLYKAIEGIPHLDINTLDKRASKRVKNKASRRKLPLHPELVKCGLLAYVEERQGSGDVQLFPDLRASVSDQVTGNWSKWWGRTASATPSSERVVLLASRKSYTTP